MTRWNPKLLTEDVSESSWKRRGSVVDSDLVHHWSIEPSDKVDPETGAKFEIQFRRSRLVEDAEGTRTNVDEFLITPKIIKYRNYDVEMESDTEDDEEDEQQNQNPHINGWNEKENHIKKELIHEKSVDDVELSESDLEGESDQEEIEEEEEEGENERVIHVTDYRVLLLNAVHKKKLNDALTQFMQGCFQENISAEVGISLFIIDDSTGKYQRRK